LYTVDLALDGYFILNDPSDVTNEYVGSKPVDKPTSENNSKVIIVFKALGTDACL
jgi:hypothetical protein